ncbi:hypothetical protein HY498_02935 [Candidatus Woesearchaeota archaeon]|nr:hypothetical protein [Candidatus Woesearchaeota archaeon]
MNKKGFLMIIASIGFIVAIFLLIEYQVTSKGTLGKNYYGSDEVRLLKLYQIGDEINFNLNYFALEAYKRSLLRLGKNGGWSKLSEPIGTKTSSKPDFKGELKKEFLKNLNDLIIDFKNLNYKEFEEKEVQITDKITGKGKSVEIFDEDKDIWFKIEPEFSIELKDFNFFEDSFRLFGLIRDCVKVEKTNLNKCLNNSPFDLSRLNVSFDDKMDYVIVMVDAGKKLFYRGDVETFEIKYVVKR